MAGSSFWRLGLGSAAALVLGLPGAALAQTDPAKTPDATAPPTNPPSAPGGKAVAPAKPALAKPGPSKSTQPPVKTVDAITVMGAQPDVQTSIDKRSFTLGKDLQATTGSIADALRNVPSVDVDLQGNLSLRGDSNVTILVDGKPSPMFEGKGRADALQQLPADQIERVEVITNPSAALNPEGSGGVINLITKTSRGSGVTGSAYVTATTAGLKRTGVNLGYNSPKLAVTASLAGNYQRNKNHATDLRGGLDPISGEFLNTFDTSLGRNLTRGPTARVNFTYTPEKKDQFTGAMTYNEIIVHGHPFDHLEEDGADGAPIEVSARQGARRFVETDTSFTAGWRHSFSGEGHDLSVDLVQNNSISTDHTVYTTLEALPTPLTPFEEVHDDATQHHDELRVAYNQALGGGSLKAGYELRYDDNDFPFSDAQGVTALSLMLVPSLANHFIYKQTVNSIYATYEHAFGDLDAQFGLRAETVNIALDQLTSDQNVGQDYSKIYPTLHLTYKLDDDRKLSASYSERVQRPPAVFLNPLEYVQPPNEVQQGNPDLKPQITHSFELGYEQHSGQSSYQATLYYRRYVDQFSQVVIDLGNGIFEDTFDNVGSSQSTGLELTANGRFTSKLSYSANTTLYWNQINAGNLGVGSPAESAFGVNGRLNLNWQVRTDDMLQFNASANGKRLVAQGVMEPNYTLNLGWRHKINDRITATLTAQDLTASSRFVRRLDTPTLIERLDVRPVNRQVFFRLDYRFGASGKAAKDPGFEYENGAGPS